MTWIRLDPDEIDDVGRAVIDAGEELGAVRNRLQGLAQSGGLGPASAQLREALDSHAEAVRLLGAIYAVLGIDIITRAIRLLHGESLAEAVSTTGVASASVGSSAQLVFGLAGSVVGGSGPGWAVDAGAMAVGAVVGGNGNPGRWTGMEGLGFVGGASGANPLVVGAGGQAPGLESAVVGGSWSPEPPPTDDQLRARALGAQLEDALRSGSGAPARVTGAADLAAQSLIQGINARTLDGIYRSTQIIGANLLPTTSGLERANEIHLERLFGSPV